MYEQLLASKQYEDLLDICRVSIKVPFLTLKSLVSKIDNEIDKLCIGGSIIINQKYFKSKVCSLLIPIAITNIEDRLKPKPIRLKSYESSVFKFFLDNTKQEFYTDDNGDYCFTKYPSKKLDVTKQFNSIQFQDFLTYDLNVENTTSCRKIADLIFGKSFIVNVKSERFYTILTTDLMSVAVCDSIIGSPIEIRRKCFIQSLDNVFSNWVKFLD